MKARVKSTGEIVEVYESCNEDFPWTDEVGDKIWKTEELIFLETTEENSDYWTKLEHQYAGMAMQGMLSNTSLITVLFDATKDHDELLKEVIICSHEYAHALVKKMKEERK